MEPEDVKSDACVSFEEEAEKAGSERKDDGEEFRKTGRQASSRIPTFQSSQARKRVIVQSAESSQKTDGSNQPVQKERTGSAEISRGKTLLTGGRDTALPISSARLHTSNDDVYSQSDILDHGCTVSAHKRNHSDDQTAEITQDSNQSPLTETPTTTDFDVESTVQCETENEDTLTQHQQVPPQDANVHANKSDRVETDQAIKLQDNVKKGSLQDTVDRTCQITDCGITEMVAKQSPAPYKHGECSSRRQDEAAQTDSEQSSKKTHQPISSADALHTKHTTETPTSVKASQKRFTMFHLLPLILLLSGFGLHIWQYGIPTSVSHLMSQLELHWLEGFSIGQEECTSDCRLTIVESIPEGMHFHSGSPHLPSISETWANLLNGANSSVHISAFYFTLRDSDLGLTEPSSVMGKKVFNLLKQLEPKGVKLKIAVNAPQSYIADTDELVATGAEVRGVDLQSVTGGVLHTKLWVVDKKRLFVGSSNMDWRSLTQVKEVGVSIEDCSCVAHDALRIFNVYWEIGGQKNGSLPPFWPGRFSALSSSKYPLAVTFNGVPARVYLSSSPPPLSSYGRSDDLSSILSVISDAKQFIFVSVMDYLPTSQFTKPIRFWPVIDSALREAACVRGVEVKLLVSCWSHSPGAMFVFMQSLSVLSKPPLSCNIHVKIFEVPSTPEQQRIPFARVNHAKYMVTDRVVYIGTSNWSEDYFTTTAGVGLVVNQTGSTIKKGQQTVQSQLQKVFQRDWHSEYTQDLSDAHAEHCSGKRHT